MTYFRFIPLALVVSVASTLIACNTAPAMPAMPAMPAGVTASSGAMPGSMAGMDAQMKTMRDMHDKMMSDKTPEERSKLMVEHMKVMQDGMAMKGMSNDVGTHHPMMEKRMEMMHSTMRMMMDRLPAAPAK